MAQENQYLELQELQEPQRLRSTSSGRFGDQDSDTDSEVNYYNFLCVRLKLLVAYIRRLEPKVSLHKSCIENSRIQPYLSPWQSPNVSESES